MARQIEWFSKYSLVWMCLWWCSAALANPAEYTILSNYKESSQRLEKGLTSAEFISGNGISNSIGSAPFSGNVQATAGIMMSDDRVVFETFTMATVNHTYFDRTDEMFRLTGENNAKFGEGRVFAVTGKLVHVTSAKDINDHTACHPKILGTNGKRLPVGEPWIALVRRGVCKFEDKVKHVYLENAVGVIVYNDRDSQTLDKMQITDKERNITSVFTYKGIGEQLADFLGKGFDVTTTITPGETIQKQYQNMNRTSVLFVSISFIILMIISLVWLVFYYVQRFRYLQSKDKQSRRMCNVAKRIIAKIPTKSVRTEDKELQNECCPICIEQYRVSDLIRVLPCKHEFHKACIDPWLLDHRLCPMCKIDVLKYYGFVFTGSQESILQMDLDVGEEDTDAAGETNHSRGISPMPQIRSSERMLSRSSSLNSDVDIQIITEATPSLQWTERDCEEPAGAMQGHQRGQSEKEEPTSSSVAALLRTSNPVVQPYTDEVVINESNGSFQQQKNHFDSSSSRPSNIQVPVADENLHCRVGEEANSDTARGDGGSLRSKMPTSGLLPHQDYV